MVKISVNGMSVLIDDEDTHLLRGWNWYLNTCGSNIYVRGYRKGESHLLYYLHRVVIGATTGQEVDHINGNGLDNRRANLRFVTRSQNIANRYATTSNSGYKGVHFEKFTGRWLATIMKDGRRYNLGRYNSAEEAAEAYDKKARELFPEHGHGSSRNS